MRSMLKLVCTFFLLGISTYAQTPEGSEAHPFHISSRGSAFGVQAEFEGTYRVYSSSIEVNVSKATLYVSEHCPYQGRRMINYIKFGLWNEESSRKIENSTPPLYLYVVMAPRQEHPLSDLHFSLPKESTLDLAKSWLVVEIQEEILDIPINDGRKGYAFVHSCGDIFTKRASRTADQKISCK